MKFAKKLNLLFSFIFALSASFASIHEVEHIKHHDTSSCMVCVIKHNIGGSVEIKQVQNSLEFNAYSDFLTPKKLYTNHKPQTTSSRDPPLFS
ncbi:MAG: hypothetical protein WCR69_01210 [Sulfuricurvum sp.]|jgi:hypothetical protein